METEAEMGGRRPPAQGRLEPPGAGRGVRDRPWTTPVSGRGLLCGQAEHSPCGVPRDTDSSSEEGDCEAQGFPEGRGPGVSYSESAYWGAVDPKVSL